MLLSVPQLLVISLLIGGFFFYLARKKAIKFLRIKCDLHSMPIYHGSYVLFWTVMPMLLMIIIWIPLSRIILNNNIINLILDAGYQQKLHPLISNAVFNYISGLNPNANSKIIAIAAKHLQLANILIIIRAILAIILIFSGALWALQKITASFCARNYIEKYIRYLMIACAAISVLTTFAIVLSLLFESINFFNKIHPKDFFFNTLWSPQTAMRPDQIGSSGSFGIIALLIGTALISIIALLVAVPIGLFSAIYLSEYASFKLRAIAKPMLEILAGIPTVVYGFFAALTIAPLIRNSGELLGLKPSSESALAAGIVMGIMIIPFVSSLSDDVISAVPKSLREGSYALGATQSETIKKVVLPAALPGIVSAILLAASRALGETMIVVMAAGLSARLTINPLEAVTTITVQMVNLLQGDQEFDSAKTLSAFALGLTLFIITFILNLYALHIVKKYREKYE